MSQSASQPQTLAEALLDVQRRAPKVVKDATADVPTKTGGKYKYTYTTLGKLLETIRPILTDLKLLWTAWPSISPDGKPALDYELEHVPSKEKRKGQMLLMLPANAGPQDQGGGLSYARRYALINALNLAPDKDEDGAMPGGEQAARGAQARKITKAKAGELWESAMLAGVTDRLQPAASHVLGANVGDCTTKEAAEKALVKLNTQQGAKLAEWISKKAAEALDA